MTNNNRLYTLDYLRGIAAFTIMLYHCLSWAWGDFPPDSFMGKCGVYGVSIFYILSGLTLYHVYYDKMLLSKTDLSDFFVKRLFRIFPLLWLVTLLTPVVHGTKLGIASLLVNLTGAFSIIRPHGYIGTGVWSIGNELVFYLLFPVMVFLAKQKNQLLFALFSLLILTPFLYFAFIGFDKNTMLDNLQQWIMYVNPMNQAFLFWLGFAMGKYLTSLKIPRSGNFILLILAIAAFEFYPLSGNNLSYGINRIVLAALCFLICLSFYKNTSRLPSFANNLLTKLGEASYSVYLVHPLVWHMLQNVFTRYSISISPTAQVIMTIGLTLILSYTIYKLFETPFVKMGKKASKALNGYLTRERSQLS